jgi:hypothetical protein
VVQRDWTRIQLSVVWIAWVSPLAPRQAEGDHNAWRINASLRTLSATDSVSMPEELSYLTLSLRLSEESVGGLANSTSGLVNAYKG